MNRAIAITSYPCSSFLQSLLLLAHWKQQQQQQSRFHTRTLIQRNYRYTIRKTGIVSLSFLSKPYSILLLTYLAQSISTITYLVYGYVSHLHNHHHHPFLSTVNPGGNNRYYNFNTNFHSTRTTASSSLTTTARATTFFDTIYQPLPYLHRAAATRTISTRNMTTRTKAKATAKEKEHNTVNDDKDKDNDFDGAKLELANTAATTTIKSPTNRKRRSNTKTVTVDNEQTLTTNKVEDHQVDVVSKKRRSNVKKQEATNTNVEDPVTLKEMSSVTTINVDDTTTITKSKKQSSSKSPPHQVLTEKDYIPKLWDDTKASMNQSYTFKVASWNVAGIRAVLNKTPTIFQDLVSKHDLDILCLQETKLQEQHITDPKLNLIESIGLQSTYDDYWSCSVAKKGYSGTAVFIRRRRRHTSSSASVPKDTKKKQSSMLQFVKSSKTNGSEISKSDNDEKNIPTLPINVDLLIPTNISYGMGNSKHDNEGRIIVVEYPLFTLCNVYVPNAGQNLERLSYRVNEWDKDFLQFIHNKRTERNGLPVIWLGDLNVAHTNLEVWNDGAKHLPKQAGVTPEERASFQKQLDSGHIDAFRYLHPKASGHYSYWSMRAGNRIVNKGLRLDYFICDPCMFENHNEQTSTSTSSSSPVIVRDCYMDSEQQGSDHCPVILEIEIKGSNFP